MVEQYIWGRLNGTLGVFCETMSIFRPRNYCLWKPLFRRIFLLFLCRFIWKLKSKILTNSIRGFFGHAFLPASLFYSAYVLRIFMKALYLNLVYKSKLKKFAHFWIYDFFCRVWSALNNFKYKSNFMISFSFSRRLYTKILMLWVSA